MSSGSTDPGRGGFPETEWTLICNLSGRPEQRRQGLEALAGLYWKPICLYLRQALRVEREASRDLTQSFFAWLLSTPVLERYEPDRGTFRAYLKGVLRNFTLNQQAIERTQKRGGGQVFAQLDLLGFDALPDPQAADPEQAFDLAWAQDLIRKATEKVQEHLIAEARQGQLEAFRAYDMSPPGTKPTYASVAADLAVSERSVRHHVVQTRERVRSQLRAEIMDTVRSPEQLDSEWRELLGL